MTYVQERYPEELAHCYGCGRLNEHGLHVQTRWDGAEGVARFLPAPYHLAIPGYVYGGLIASLIDCHAIGTAAAAAEAGTGAGAAAPRFVTASLHVDYLAPTPTGVELELRARPIEVGERKVVVAVELRAGATRCATGRVVAVRLPATMTPASPDPGP